MRRLTGEDGATAVLLALLLVPLVGFGALVLDVGQMYWELRQLQNGADAAALAVAQDCAVGNCGDTDATAEDFADGNANDEASEALVAKPGDLGDDSVTVTTSTRSSSGESFLTHSLAGVLGVPTSSFEREATAVWGYAASLGTFPLVISTCEYDVGTTATFASPHPNASAARQKLLFHQGTGGDEDPCNAQAGHDTDGDGFLPAGFGWLVNDGSCRIVTTVVDGDEWVDKDSGANPECDENDLLPLVDTVVQIPVFNDFCRPPHDPAPDCPDYNNNDKYRIATYASFYLEGFRFPGTSGGDHSFCSPSESCVVGYFTTSTALEGEIGGPEGGVLIVKLGA